MIARTLIAAFALSALSIAANAASLDFIYTVPTKLVDGTNASIASCNLFNVTVAPHVKMANLPLTGKHTFNLVSTNNTQRYAMNCTTTAGTVGDYSNPIEVTTKMQNATTIQVTVKTTMAGAL